MQAHVSTLCYRLLIEPHAQDIIHSTVDMAPIVIQDIVNAGFIQFEANGAKVVEFL